MRTRTGWLALMLTTGIALLAPSTGWGQGNTGGDVPPEDPPTFLPLYHDRPETGGFFAAAEFLWWRQTNPVKEQLIAVRGFTDTTGAVQDALNLLNGDNAKQSVPGTHFGSSLAALDADQVSGPGSYEPGFDITLGWRFEDGISLEFTWRHLQDVKYTASAGPIPANDWPGSSWRTP